MKIALVENFGSDFYGARLRYAKFLINKGHEVIAIIPDDGYVDKVRASGVNVIPVSSNIRQRSFVNIFTYFKQMCKIIKSNNFDVMHFYRMQPNLIGSFAAGLSGRKKIYNHITGFGIAFSKQGIKNYILKWLILNFYRLNHFLFDTRIILQNEEDKKELGLNSEKVVVIKGSAVNESHFDPENVDRAMLVRIKNDIGLKQRTLKLLFVSRLLKQKGLLQLIQAVDEININFLKVELIVVGWVDLNNPDSFTQEEIKEFSQINGVHFLGKRDDVRDLIAVSDICVLPTYYREGTPRFLLESMAMAKAILTADMPGCNHLVKEESNGLLVKPRSAKEIKYAIEKMISANLDELGEKSREIYLTEFSEEIVYNSIYKFYFN